MEDLNLHKITDNQETVISINDLHKSFDDLKVLCGIDLKLRRRENLTVLGR
jgi:ABC-type polar amino acid transport system ATPase subunit